MSKYGPTVKWTTRLLWADFAQTSPHSPKKLFWPLHYMRGRTEELGFSVQDQAPSPSPYPHVLTVIIHVVMIYKKKKVQCQWYKLFLESKFQQFLLLIPPVFSFTFCPLWQLLSLFIICFSIHYLCLNHISSSVTTTKVCFFVSFLAWYAICASVT